ncbi:MAG: hypothetical protein ACI4HI_11110 [Lachnospiraceae bacterium]
MRKNNNKLPSFGTKAKQLSDTQNSAWILCTIGIIGLLICLLIFNDIIHVAMEAFTHTLFLSSMSTLFVFFLAEGLLSCLKVRRLKKESEKEETELKRLFAWFLDHFSAQQIDVALGFSIHHPLPDDAFLLRSHFILEQLRSQSDFLPDASLNLLTDTLIQTLFP